MLDSFLTTIQKYNMLAHGDHIIAGLSGGADSVLLLTLLWELREKYGLVITAAHIHHGIRGAEADEDEAFSRLYCERLGAVFLPFHRDVPGEAEISGLSLEEAGRKIRYQCLEEAMKSRGANKIAVAHNRNDNAETVFMHICRGTGLTGLCGIPPVRGHIIRPLIEIGRDEIESYLSGRGISYRTDSTNLSADYTRNRIRNALIPEIESALQINLREKLTALSGLCARDEDFLEITAGNAYKAALISEGSRGVTLSVPALRALHPAVISRVIRRALSKWGLKDVAVSHIQAAECLINAQTGKQTALPGGVSIVRSYDELCFSSGGIKAPKTFCYGLKPDIPLYVPELSKYFLLSEKKTAINIAAVCTKAFPYDKIGDIQIRSRLPGDRLRIRHIGAVKLKDYFINNKIPSYQRDGIGLAAQGGEVLWILDKKNICHEQYEVLDSETCKIYIHMWE